MTSVVAIDKPLVFDQPILSAICDESDGPVERFVYKMMLTPNNFYRLWQESSKYRTLFTDDVNGDFEKYCQMFVSQDPDNPDRFRAHGLFWVIDDFIGVYYLTHIFPEREATAHFTFFDRRLHGREELTRAMIRYVFERYSFERLNVEIPVYASRSTFMFVEKGIGAACEGRKRKAVVYKDARYDVVLFGILREEVVLWEPKLVK